MDSAYPNGPVLTVRQIGIDQTVRVAQVFPRVEGYVVAALNSGEPDEQHDTGVLAEVLRSSPALRVDGDAEVHIQHDVGVIGTSTLLDALVVTGEPPLGHEWDLDDDSDFWPVEESSARWSTGHHIEVNDRLVFGVTTGAGEFALIAAEDHSRPHEDWLDLLAFHWDSADYSAVGMAGSGTDGVYQVRPGLVAIVSATDDDYSLRIDRVDPQLSAADLVAPRLAEIVPPDVALTLLGASEAVEGSAEPPVPGDRWSTTLEATEIAALVDALRHALPS